MAEQVATRLSPLQAVKGMNDILPPDSARWEWFEGKVRALMACYGYANVRTPIVEPTALFVRGLGEVTDIVEKEMYSFEDAMNGDRLSLRPEATAAVVNGPGESKHANIGISLPGSGEAPVAPVFIDGERSVTLKGERIAEEFQAIVDDYVRRTYASRAAPAAAD